MNDLHAGIDSGCPLVTVVIPCFNMGATLTESVESAANQTYRNLEIVVVDDGSTDLETLEILKSLPSREFGDVAVRVFSKTNGGVGSAINFGVQQAAGKYYMPLGDDLIDAPYIYEAVEQMERNPNLGIVYCRAEFFGKLQGDWGLPDFDMSRQLWDNCIFATSLYRTDDWKTVGGLDESMVGREDHDYILKTLGLGRTVHRLEGRYFHYRREGFSVNDRVAADRAKLVDSTAKMFRNNLDLYGANAEIFVSWIYSLIDERNDLANKYRRLEKARNSLAGRMAVKVVRNAKESIRKNRK